MWIIQISCCLLAILDLYLLNHLTHSQETALLSPTPQIHRLTPNFIFDTLEVEWYDSGSVFLEEMDATWQIQILRKELMEEVALETYHSKLSAHKKLLHWTWTSDLPFNCTTHYVRIRCQLHGNTLEESEWGQWSQVANITGKDTGSTTQMYPIDRMVRVGSDVTFCCVWKNGQSLISVHYADCSTEWCWTSPLSERSMLIHVHNVRASIQSGNNAWCNLHNYPGPGEVLTGTVLFVGYPPDVPQNLKCEPWLFKEIKCRWGRGRSTNLYGLRKTSYFLFERVSGKNITCTGEGGDPKYYQCSFPILSSQTTYDFTVQAVNHLGQAKASLLIHIKV